MSDLDYQQAYRRHRGQASQAATRRRGGCSADEAAEIEALVAAERARPDTYLGKLEIASRLRWRCVRLCSEETWLAFARQLTEIGQLNLRERTAGYGSLYAYLTENDPEAATVEGMLAAFRAGVAGCGEPEGGEAGQA